MSDATPTKTILAEAIEDLDAAASLLLDAVSKSLDSQTTPLRSNSSGHGPAHGEGGEEAKGKEGESPPGRAISPKPEPPEFSGPLCKGSYALGTACGSCQRCEWYRRQGHGI